MLPQIHIPKVCCHLIPPHSIVFVSCSYRVVVMLYWYVMTCYVSHVLITPWFLRSQMNHRLSYDSLSHYQFRQYSYTLISYLTLLSHLHSYVGVMWCMIYDMSVSFLFSVLVHVLSVICTITIRMTCHHLLSCFACRVMLYIVISCIDWAWHMVVVCDVCDV